MRNGCCFVPDPDFSTTADPLSSAHFSVSNECICGDDILSNTTLITGMVADLNALQQQVASLNRSVWTLNESKTAIQEFDDLIQTVTRAMTHIITLNGSVSDISSDTIFMQNAIAMFNESIVRVMLETANLNRSVWTLNESKTAMYEFDDLKQTVVGTMNDIVTLNDSITTVQLGTGLMQSTISTLNSSVTTVISDTAALVVSVSELNDSQLVSSSIVPDWPDAIICNRTEDGALTNFDIAVHYLAVAGDDSGEYAYQWVPSPYLSKSDAVSRLEFSTSGTYAYIANYYGGSGGFSAHDCDGKSIQQLRDEGKALDLAVTSKR